MDRDNRQDDVLQCYRDMKSIMLHQLTLLQNSNDEEALQQFAALSVQYGRKMEELSAREPYQRNEEIRELLAEMERYAEEMEQLLQRRIDVTAHALQHTVTQRMAVRSYGNMDFQDAVPLYFDQKR